MNEDEKAAIQERIKQDEALHEKLHEQMLSDSKKHDDALAKMGGVGDSGVQTELTLTTSTKKGK